MNTRNCGCHLRNWSTCKCLLVVRRAMASGAKRYINLQDEEILIRHAYHVIEQRMNAAE